MAVPEFAIGVLLRGVVLPGALAAAFGGGGGAAAPLAPRAGAFLAGLGLAVGYAAGHVGVLGRGPGFPPSLTTDQIAFLLAPLGLLLGAAALLAPARPWLQRGLSALAALGAAALMLRVKLTRTWSGGTSALALLGATLAALLLLEAFARLAPGSEPEPEPGGADRPRRPPTLALIGLVWTATGALTLVQGSSVVLAQQAGALAAAWAPLLLLSLWRPTLSRLEAARPVLVLTLGLLVLRGLAFASLPLGAAALLVAAPWAAQVARLPALAGRAWTGAAAAAAAVALLGGAAAGLAGWWTRQEGPAPW